MLVMVENNQFPTLLLYISKRMNVHVVAPSWINLSKVLKNAVPSLKSQFQPWCKKCKKLVRGAKNYKPTILKLEKWVADTLKEDYDKLHEEIVRMKAVNADK